MENLKNLFEKTLPELYGSDDYQNKYGIAITDSERPHVELRNK